jgi:hypothetical protein
VKDIYHESYKALMKETQEDIKNWKDILYSWIGRPNIVKMLISLKETYRLSATLIKIPMAFFTELEKIILNFIWNYKTS